MFRQKPFPFSFVVLIILFIFHLINSHYSLYWKYPHLDIVIHILSGLWLTLVCLWLFFIFGQIDSLREYKIKSFLISFIVSILFGIFWEILENFAKVNYVNSDVYYLDTTLDILSGGFGGILAYFYFIKMKKNKLDVPNNFIGFNNNLNK